MTRPWTEEQIAAYVDGSIEDETEANQIRRVLETDDAARGVADRIEAANALLQKAFPVPESDETPAAIKAAILGEPGKVAAFKPKRPVFRFMPAAIAASFALVVGLAGGRLLPFPDAGPQTAQTGSVSLADAGALQGLETLRGGEETGTGLTATSTFLDSSGRPCREFERAPADRDYLEFGLACRAPDGAWQAEIVVTTPFGPAAGDAIVPASGGAAGVLEPVLEALGAGLPLGPDEEDQLIRDGWRNAN